MVDLTFPAIARSLRALALPPVDLVVGIARGGIVLATLAAYETDGDLAVIRLNYRDDDNRPRHEEPVLLSPLPQPGGERRVLLVDDVSVSGRTLAAARALFDGCDVSTLVLKGRADFVLFPDVASCVTVPWSPLDPALRPSRTDTS